MAANEGKTSRNVSSDAIATAESDPHVIAIDPTAPAGSESALGAESVRDGRPATRDDVVEAIDEEGPGVTAPLAKERAGSV